MPERTNLSDLLTKLRELDGHEVSLGDVVAALEDRGFGPVMLAPALIAMVPSGAIPGVPSACGLLIFLVAVQLVFGKRHPWLPKKLRQIAFPRQKFQSGIERIMPAARWIDRFLRPRLKFLTDWPVSRVMAGICALLGLSMIPLELIPLATAGPAASIVLASLALSTRDGVLVVISAAVLMVTAILLFAWV